MFVTSASDLIKKKLILSVLLEQDGGICCAVLLKLAATPVIGSYIV
jgi:hypothetical protein